MWAVHDGDVVGCFARCSFYFFVTFVPNEQDFKVVTSKADCFTVDLGHQRTGGINGLHVASFSFSYHRW